MRIRISYTVDVGQAYHREHEDFPVTIEGLLKFAELWDRCKYADRKIEILEN